MDFEWMKLGQAAILLLFLVAIFPAMKWWNKNSPEAKSGDWNAALLPLVGVVLFVAFLVWTIRQ